MSESKIQEIVNRMDPKQAASEIGEVMKTLLPLLDEDARIELVMNIVGDSGHDKVSSLVHLWLAECMGEGVNLAQMCQNLVNKVTQSRQLSAVAEPEVLVLFESWLEELESEVISFAEKTGSLDPIEVAEKLGMSRSGATFLITKLKREGKL